MFYLVKSKCLSIQQFWDQKGFVIQAVYGPSDKQSALEYRDDMIEAYKEEIDFARPNNTITTYFTDDDNDYPDDDDYAGIIS
jgi:hypothetical protein